MTASVRVNRRALRLKLDVEGTPTVDISFDGHRVWSTRVPAPDRNGARVVAWPEAIVPYLHGRSTIAVRLSADGSDLVSRDVQFGGHGRVAITDPQGRWLAMNKWNRLGPSFDGNDTGVQGRLLSTATHLAAKMQEWGYPIYIVGGTLLGAMRSGALLGHDDDIDFAFWCDKSDPQDVSLVSFEVERLLEKSGYSVVRHSHAHLELVFFTDQGSIDYYIDIFTGYHSQDGLYNQPFALRGELPRESLVPTRDVVVNGVSLPAPAVPEAWLTFAYGPGWRVPDPSFVFETPRGTRRRFENSFGVLNRQRVFWEKTWEKRATREESTEGFADVDRFLQALPENAFVVDLGCGDGRLTERIAAAGHEVIGYDYSHEALRIARQTCPEGARYEFLNLNDGHAMARLALDLVTKGRQPYFFSRNVLHEMVKVGRTEVFRTLRYVLDPGTFLYAVWDTNPVQHVQAIPETWHLRFSSLKGEAWRFSLGVTPLATSERMTQYGKRTGTTALIWR